MLLSYSVQNWKIFDGTASISLMAGSGRRFEHSLHKLPEKYDRRRVLPVAALFGGCASGKSSFVESIQAARAMVLGESARCTIPNRSARMNPTTFAVLFLIRDCCYELRFSVLNGRIEAEQLVELTSSVAKTLYYRKGSGLELSDERLRLDSAFAKECPPDKLLLCEIARREHPAAVKIADWFRNSVLVVRDECREVPIKGMLFSAEDLESRMNELLRDADAGFDGFKLVPASNDEIRDLALPDLRSGRFGSACAARRGRRRFYARRIDGRSECYKVCCSHKSPSGEIIVPIEEESSSASRLFDICAASACLLESVDPIILIYDELDRGAGTRIVASLLKRITAAGRSYNQSQFIFTGENPLSFSLSELRRDEIHRLERSRGVSQLPIPANKREKFSLSVYPFAEVEFCA